MGRVQVGDKTISDRSDSEKNLLLDRQLCFAMHASARAIAKVYMETLRQENLTYPQYLVLIVLLEEEGVTVSEIGHQLHLDSGTLTPLIKRMEKEKILVRRRSEEDERQVQVFLTNKGRKLRGIAMRARERVVDRLDMSDRDIIKLRKQLMVVADRLKAD